jgi:hypothetical protein
MTIYPPQNYSPDNDSNFAEYDLESQKKAIAEATEEIKKELLEKWERRYADAQIFPARLQSVNPNVLDFLLSFQNTLFYNQLSSQFKLSPEQRDILPHIVWEICLSRKWQDLENMIAANLKVDFSAARQLSDSVKKNIILKAQELSEKSFSAKPAEKAPENKTISLPVADALKTYPEISDQLITQNSIRVKYFNDPVRPSIKNWLSDYTANLGYDRHNSMERGNYLFQSENTKNLGYEDRQKLSQILKSFDEKTVLQINTNTKQIIFDSSPLQMRRGIEGEELKSSYQLPPRPASQLTSPHLRGEGSDFQSNYQPRTQEPGNNFEKVIGLHDKEEDFSTINVPRIVNLKESAGEKPAAPVGPQPKNLLNIKDLVEQSRKEKQETEMSAYDFVRSSEKRLVPPARPAYKQPFPQPSAAEKKFDSAPSGSPEMAGSGQKEKSLAPKNNSIRHDFFPDTVKKHPVQENYLRDSLDEAEKKLFQTNNQLAASKNAETISGKYFEEEKPAAANLQFSSPQKLPYEKEREEIEKNPLSSRRSDVPQAPEAEPYRIHPSSF